MKTPSIEGITFKGSKAKEYGNPQMQSVRRSTTVFHCTSVPSSRDCVFGHYNAPGHVPT